MPLPQFYGPDDGAGARPISFFVALFRSDDWLGLVLMVGIAVIQLLALIPLYRRPALASIILFFFGSLSYALVGLVALLLRVATATQNINGLWDGPPFPHQLIYAECVGAVGAVFSLCSLLLGILFYVFRWRHTVSMWDLFAAFD